MCHLQINVFTGGNTHKCTKTNAEGKQHGNWCPAVTLRGGAVTDGDWCSARISVITVLWRILGLEKPAGLTVRAGNRHTETHSLHHWSLMAFASVMTSVAGAKTMGAGPNPEETRPWKGLRRSAGS